MASSDDIWKEVSGIPNDQFSGNEELPSLSGDGLALHETYNSLVGEEKFTPAQALWLVGAMVTGNPGPPPLTGQPEE